MSKQIEPVAGGPEWFINSLAPELAADLREFESTFSYNLEQLSPPQRRDLHKELVLRDPQWLTENVTVEEILIPRTDSFSCGSSNSVLAEIRIRIYTPKSLPAANSAAPFLLCIHGGGMWAGSIESEQARFAKLALDHNAVAISVDYRLAPEHPYPAGLADCVDAYLWAANNASELGLDLEKIVIYGGSAGGGLAIATAMWLKDHAEILESKFERKLPQPKLIMALYPMLDPRNDTVSAKQVDRSGNGAWSRNHNAEAWKWYLGSQTPDIYAAPITATPAQLSGLATVYMDVGQQDMFRDENLQFATLLSAAGVAVELHVTPGIYHGSENRSPQAESSQNLFQLRNRALKLVFQ